MRRIVYVFLLTLCEASFLHAQAAPLEGADSGTLLDIDALGDIDSLFEEKTPPAAASNQTKTPAADPAVAAPQSKPAVAPQSKPPAAQPASVISNLKKKGFSLNASYSFTGGFFPGWDEAPWYWDEYPYYKETSLPAVLMTSSLGLNYQISDTLGVRSTFSFSFPKFAIAVETFYLDYSINNKVFLRAGKFTYNWGISRDFVFANLLALVPSASQRGNATGNTKYYNENVYYEGNDEEGEKNIPAGWYPKKVARYTPYSGKNDAYTARLSIPIGIGGLEFVAIARDDFFVETNIQKDLIYWGGKYNLAFKKVDINTGFMYSEIMPLHIALSVKTTILNTEIYSEGIAAIGSGELIEGELIKVGSKGEKLAEKDQWAPSTRERKWDALAFSGSVGVARDFFSKKLTVGAEYFYNGESDLQWMTEADIEKGLTSKVRELIQGNNLALNLSFKPGWRDLRFAVKFLYGIDYNTMTLVPGIRVVPFPNMAVSLGVLMALGNRADKGYEDDHAGYYYRHNTDEKDRPFSVALTVTFSGSHRWDNYK
ncbi:MAG: hypothetical protein LBF60_08085 [Treponema sp.]|jgi:hypothetical protein|nr:hypothetical protein [Treponema sp.]